MIYKEIKLGNNTSYRNEMVNITLHFNITKFLFKRTIVYDCSLRIADPKLILLILLETPKWRLQRIVS